MLQGKKILLGVTGGIAAYKAAALASKLTQAGAVVKVMMTTHAKEFVTPLTFQALTRDRVYDDTFAETDPEKVAHIDIADWADMVVIAPATANILAKFANGLADDMVSTTVLAATCPVYIAPAMNVNMYEHTAVKENMDKLKQRGCHFIEPGDGYLACGWIGKGRLAEPEDITAFLQSEYEQSSVYAGKKILITAGPTYEYSDPVRVFTNPSTGKMGFAAAAEAAAKGAIVTLITGPVQLDTPSGVTRIDVTTAEEMYEAVMERFPFVDMVCKAAAVSDYRPALIAAEKQKKQNGDLSIEMERTKDILAELGKRKDKQLLIGFAAESENVVKYAEEKLDRKNLDMVVANNIASKDAGFRSDTNEMILLRKDGKHHSLPLLTKTEAAKEMFAFAESMLKRDES
ncbi:bifunctional phosphopantothenoylcysteine decarboxylase/phosphopantothenate--cysteine ligase CoaBC [Salibacterium salarium]|uniref:Coenzyme A biosynthesis bifunctional protein CoaBC n=1 Tax=Salibacterium salarium TaxID=284579 RepID=A0A428MZ17_9BACI|nr:bifunctional phosphopantothenoylcysteine decarboxylase/phosphopantothenate--cysteine ligase CoaBC [Salibacterium salarium]RSL31279.1 bifunctional phosphopantothenoylcysteine decarboxylase/phosphopantothenate--cysteine ligase CoaBC [Salibacterium salarium]